ncbi:MAG TPA: hypothetical protein VH206_02680 [Xanthobacteraceae bacterium]|nr:hypothetical protein [Xanthobacteraceae bacterium]
MLGGFFLLLQAELLRRIFILRLVLAAFVLDYAMILFHKISNAALD